MKTYCLALQHVCDHQRRTFSAAKMAVLVASVSWFCAATGHAAIITDTFSRDLTAAWGSVDNASVGGETGTVAASYTLDGGVDVVGGSGTLSNQRVVLDYNLATDSSIIAAGGFNVRWQVNPTDGDSLGNGREFAGIGLSDSNTNPPYGGAGAITNGANDTLRYAVLPRNSGSAGTLTRTTGNIRTLTATGDPNSPGFNEQVFDPIVFADYSSQSPLPDPFVNNTFYDVSMDVLGDFTAGSEVFVTTTINGVALAPETIEWGVGGQAYLSAVAFNGPHQYDNLVITAVPEPTGVVLLLSVCTAIVARRKRSNNR